MQVLEGVAAVSLGWSHSAALKTDGSLWTWGWNKYGQLGDGTTEERSTPVKIMEGVAAVSLGWYHSAALKTDGSLWTWGYNNRGQLGDGTTEDRSTPVKIMEGVAAVSLGEEHSAALKTDGSLWTWGRNNFEQLGDGTNANSSVPICIVPPGDGSFILSFDPNGGTVSLGSKAVACGEAYGELPVPTFADHSFLGWFTQAEGGEQITGDMTVSPEDAQTLYAHWEALKPVTAPSITVSDISYSDSGEATVSVEVNCAGPGSICFACYSASGRLISTAFEPLTADRVYTVSFTAGSKDAASFRLILLNEALSVQEASERISLG